MDFADRYDHLEIAAMDDPFPDLAEAGMHARWSTARSTAGSGRSSATRHQHCGPRPAVSSAQGSRSAPRLPMSLPRSRRPAPAHATAGPAARPVLARCGRSPRRRAPPVGGGLIAAFAGRGEADLARSSRCRCRGSPSRTCWRSGGGSGPLPRMDDGADQGAGEHGGHQCRLRLFL